MRIFRLRPDYQYQPLWPDTDAEYEVLQDFDGRSWAGAWKPMVLVRYRGDSAKRNLKLSDFPSLRRGSTVFSRRAIDGLRDLLEPNGEILPADFSEADYALYNVTTLLNTLDEERSEIERFRDGRVMDIFKYTFLPDRLGTAAIFKLVQATFLEPFVTDQFVERVRDLKLTGFEFKQVWEG
ncbi:MAG: hypothetical protein K0R39_5004 [Symbiobacteriaceae bacterium]|jgi:hypothetical protein|nr:hypothetical protein [Symbiobacteriaceae bacterium]